MDKEEFYEMLLAFAKSLKEDADPDAFDWHLEHMDFDEDMKEQFKEMVDNF